MECMAVGRFCFLHVVAQIAQLSNDSWALLRCWLYYLDGPGNILEACTAQTDHLVTHSAVHRLTSQLLSYFIPGVPVFDFERGLAVVLRPVK